MKPLMNKKFDKVFDKECCETRAKENFKSKTQKAILLYS